MNTNTPDFYAYGVTPREGRKDILTRIGAGWKHEKGDGIGLELRALPLNFKGKIVLFAPKADEAAQADHSEDVPF